ncbi:hypothetical protein PUNSTDRAFT_134015 [Punctularia strigosozonata HHB-11173 SS5]|uniref:uncharacterized protein n=1 Tax=Punctularia strigosozonata (strain HHB-11173) TaxID=741275 RepID=UPI0004416F54|nr:uncharacterized protein PUNSTDRAFT_134015 [Punctularia strigosozonata HHB-11173 SS5]EIN08839.1 hypothetical protein PUNSTDRAFT_134015 [Punctularia strigosozonata HHB-11173 SS5]
MGVYGDTASMLGSSVQLYSGSDEAGVLAIVVSSALSLLVTLIMAVMMTPVLLHRPKGPRSHVAPILSSLMAATVLQAVGSLMNLRWVLQGYADNSTFCSAQGALKNTGNVGIAVWSFLTAAYSFDRLFLRDTCTRLGKWLLLIGGWTAVAFVPLIGRVAIQRKSNGPYFGVSGLWCWITDEYPVERFMLEYFIEFLSAGLSFILYMAVLLRVRGNLAQSNGKWRLRWVSKEDAWQLAISRDLIDSLMQKVALFAVLFPVAYGILLVPIALARFTEFAGKDVPLWATVLADMIFNLTGAVDAILILVLRRKLPEMAALPDLSTKRQKVDLDDPLGKVGITPFFVQRPTGGDDLERMVTAEEKERDRMSLSSVDMMSHPPLKARDVI